MKHSHHTGEFNGGVPMSTPPPADPVTEMLRPVEGKYRSALNALSEWHLIENARREINGCDTIEHVRHGLRLVMDVGQVGNEALDTYKTAIEMLDLEIEQLDCDAVDPTLVRRTRAEITRQRELTVFLRNRYKGMITQTGELSDQLTNRLHQLSPVGYGKPTTKH